jgi:uncharacterized protein
MIVDIHQHLGNMPVVAGVAPPELKRNLELRIAYMDRWGIDQALIMPSNAGPAPNGARDRRQDNDTVAEYIARRPERLPTAVGTVHPADGDAAMSELERCISELGFCGIVWHHRFLGVAIDHPGMDDLLTRLGELNGLAFVHVIPESGLEAPWRLEIIADRHPDVTFVALDGFASFSHASWMLYIASRHPNIYFDTGASTSVAHRFADFVARVGADRLLLGTDYYCEPHLFDIPFPLEEIRGHVDVSDADRHKILGGNAERLLRIGAAAPS